jgi:hypothetical protein
MNTQEQAQQAVNRLVKAYTNGVVLRVEAYERLMEIALEFKDVNVLEASIAFKEDNGARPSVPRVEAKPVLTIGEIVSELVRRCEGGPAGARRLECMRLVAKVADAAAETASINTTDHDTFRYTIVSLIFAAQEAGPEK